MQTQSVTAPDVIEAGRTLATLDDWRAMMFIMLFIVVFLILFTVWREWAMQSERKAMVAERAAMRELAQSFADSAGHVATSLAELSTKIAVLSALTARAETVIASQTGEKTNG